MKSIFKFLILVTFLTAGVYLFSKFTDKLLQNKARTTTSTLANAKPKKSTSTSTSVSTKLDLDKVRKALLTSKSPEEFTKKVNDLYKGDDTVSVAIRNIDGNRQEVIGYIDENNNQELDSADEKLFSFIRSDVVPQDNYQLVHYEMQGYGPYASYHYSGTQQFLKGALMGYLIGRMMHSMRTPHYYYYHYQPQRHTVVRRKVVRRVKPSTAATSYTKSSSKLYTRSFSKGSVKPNTAGLTKKETVTPNIPKKGRYGANAGSWKKSLTSSILNKSNTGRYSTDKRSWYSGSVRNYTNRRYNRPPPSYYYEKRSYNPRPSSYNRYDYITHPSYRSYNYSLPSSSYKRYSYTPRSSSYKRRSYASRSRSYKRYRSTSRSSSRRSYTYTPRRSYSYRSYSYTPRRSYSYRRYRYSYPRRSWFSRRRFRSFRRFRFRR